MQLKNEMEQKEKKCKTFHINTRKTIYFISYLAFCFVYLKHVQNFSLKYSSTQELSYI